MTGERIEDNRFYKIIFDDAHSEAKFALVAEALMPDPARPKEENLGRLEEFERFREYVDAEWKRTCEVLKSDPTTLNQDAVIQNQIAVYRLDTIKDIFNAKQSADQTTAALQGNAPATPEDSQKLPDEVRNAISSLKRKARPASSAAP